MSNGILGFALGLNAGNFLTNLANVNLPSLKSSASVGTLSASGDKIWKNKDGKIDLAKLFQVENEATGLVRNK